MEQTLVDIANGETVKVLRVASSVLRVKLMEMGLIEGKKLHVLYRAPLGDPIAVDVDGYILSLRNDEAILVHVESIKTFA